MIPVILSGGSGSRLWPLSRKQYPKQFLALTGDDTLFQQTIKRLAFDGMQAPLLVCNKEHRFIVQEQLEAQNLASQAILLEPFGRNTAPAVAIAAMKLVAEGRDELLLILPADHVIEDQRAFQQALALATNAAEIAVELGNDKQPKSDTTLNNGLKDVPSRLLTPIEVNKENIDATVIKDGFHKKSEL